MKLMNMIGGRGMKNEKDKWWKRIGFMFGGFCWLLTILFLQEILFKRSNDTKTVDKD